MDILELREYCLAMDDVTEKTPFGKFSARYDSVLVFYVLDHMFCITDINDFSSVSLYSTPEEREELKLNYDSVSTPTRKGMQNWIQIDFGGDVSDQKIYELVKRAYDIIREKYTPRGRKQKNV